MAGARKLIPGSYAKLKPRTEKAWDFLQQFFDSLKPDEKIDIDEWADKYRMLPKETSHEHGKWSTDRFPFLRRIMKCLSLSSIAKEVAVSKGAQLGFTELCIIIILYVSRVDPSPVMYVQKTGDAAKDFSNQKLKPSIDVCSEVYRSLGEGKAKSLPNSWDNKAFPGGFVVSGGANSESFIRSKSVKWCLIDEEDAFEATVGSGDHTGGSPVANLRKRTANFPGSKVYRLSTPKIKETSTIEPAVEAGSFEQYYLPCPECNSDASKDGFWFVLLWEHIIYSKKLDASNLPEDIYAQCPNCAARIDEHQKTWMLGHGRWMSEKNTPGQPYEVGDVEYPSFQISSLYSPYGFFSWRDAVREWLESEATGDATKRQVFINQTLGEAYTLSGSDVNHSHLHKRKEKYSSDDSFDIPKEALVLTAGVDIQKDRIECELVAWGLLEESWSIDYRIFMGRTDSLGDQRGFNEHGLPTAWRLLDEFLLESWQHENGSVLYPECVAIDAQYSTEQVNLFCKDREGRRVFPTHGKAGWNRGYFDRPNIRKRHQRYNTYNFTLYVDAIKKKTQSLLMVNSVGAGYCHFPQKDAYDEKYFKGLTAESLKDKWVQGKKKLGWVCPNGVRNEPTDLRCYAFGALKMYNPDLERRAKELSLITQADSGIGAEGFVLKAVNDSPVPLKKRRRRGSPGL